MVARAVEGLGEEPAEEEAQHASEEQLAGQHPRGLRLPPGRRIEIEGRGAGFYREIPGPPGAPTLVLLHGWIASGGLNWFASFETLGRYFRVIAPDMRGHGRGIRAWRRFRLADCADDVAQLLKQLDTGPVIVAGYSMGGTIAQLLWKRHPELVRGLVLTATSHHIVVGARERFLFTTALSALAGTARVGQLGAWLPRSLAERVLPIPRASRPGSLARWMAAEMARHDPRMILEAGFALGHYDASKWIGDVDVPTVVMVHTRDLTLPTRLQRQLAAAIPHSSTYEVDDGHAACATSAYADSLLEACMETMEL